MGLYKRKDSSLYWMTFRLNGRKVSESTGTANKKLAVQIHAKRLTDIAEGKWFDRPAGENKTIGDLLDKYIKEYATPNKAPNTVRTDKSMANEIKAYFGDRKLKDVTPNLIATYKSFCRDKSLSPASINHRRGLLRHAFNLAMREWEWVRENPVERVGPEKVRNARDRWLTIDDEKRLIDNCVLHPTIKGNGTEPHYWLQEIVIFALNTGMRQDEILSLEWSNVNLFGKPTVTVIRSKNGEKRTIPMNQRVFELLIPKAKIRSIRSNHVFTNEAGNKVIASNVLRAFYKALERAEIKDFRFHDLRHTFATRLAQEGVDFYKISKLMGHKDIRMTQRYSHHYPESLRDAVEVLDKIGYVLATPGNEKGVSNPPTP